MKEKKYNLFIKRPIAMEASTSVSKHLEQEPIEGAKYHTDLFVFKRYADLADAPIMYSIPDRVTFTINEIEVLLSVYSPNKIHRAATLMPQMERMIRAQKNFLGLKSTVFYYISLLLKVMMPEALVPWNIARLQSLCCRSQSRWKN